MFSDPVGSNYSTDLILDAPKKTRSNLFKSPLCIESFSLRNHQGYEIAVKRNNNTYIATCKRSGVLSECIPVIFSKTLAFNLTNLRNPYHFTYDASSKTLLYSPYGLKGGMVGHAVEDGNRAEIVAVLARKDSDLCTIIRDRLPERTYTNICVHTMDHDFGGFANPATPTRVISLTVTNSEVLCAFFFSIFAGLRPGKSELYDPINRTKLVKQVIEHIANNAHERDHIDRAYTRASEIHMFMAQNLNHFEIRFSESDVIYYTYKITDGATAILGGILGVAGGAVGVLGGLTMAGVLTPEKVKSCTIL